MTKIRLPVSLKLITCENHETASITKTPPTTTRSSSCLQQIATTANHAADDSDPVSPMKTFAGKQLNQRKAQTRADQCGTDDSQFPRANG